MESIASCSKTAIWVISFVTLFSATLFLLASDSVSQNFCNYFRTYFRCIPVSWCCSLNGRVRLLATVFSKEKRNISTLFAIEKTIIIWTKSALVNKLVKFNYLTGSGRDWIVFHYKTPIFFALSKKLPQGLPQEKVRMIW